MSVISQLESEKISPFIALSQIDNFDGSRMVNRLCKHFSHKIDAGWNDTQGYIEFAMGFCDMTAGNDFIRMRCGAKTKAELDEIRDCIDAHFNRFSKHSNNILHWRYLFNTSGGA